MTVVEVRGGPITHRSLMNKTKSELSHEVLRLIDELERADQRISELQALVVELEDEDA